MPCDIADSLKTLQSHSERFLKGQSSHPPEVTGSTGHELPRLSSGLHDIAHHRSTSTGNLAMSQDGSSGNASSSGISMASESPCHRIMENNARAQADFAPRYGTHGEVQLIEQFEPGVYVTLMQLRDGTKVFKRVRFRYSIPNLIPACSIYLNSINPSTIFLPHNTQLRNTFHIHH